MSSYEVCERLSVFCGSRGNDCHLCIRSPRDDKLRGSQMDGGNLTKLRMT